MQGVLFESDETSIVGKADVEDNHAERDVKAIDDETHGPHVGGKQYACMCV